MIETKNFKSKHLKKLLKNNLKDKIWDWYSEKLNYIIKNESSKDLFLMYSICGTKIKELNFTYENNKEELSYINIQKANLLELSRIYMLVKVLKKKRDFFLDKVKNLIHIADKREMETFLKFLIFLPEPKDFHFHAVDALRTNISSVFDAIAINNPYPSLYFTNEEWNQMYLKAAFMERNIKDILNIEKRANKDLARIISDYAHERWAASRDINPEIWQPTTQFLNEILLKDMNVLFKSKNVQENKAAALCCYHSNNDLAKKKLDKYPKLKNLILSNKLTWENFKN